MDAKIRLDRLIKKSRADMYKPIAIAEILYKSRVDNSIRLTEKEDYRRRSFDWMKAIILRLHNKTTTLNSRYWDQTFDQDVMPPDSLAQLGEVNAKYKGIVETYIYAHLRSKFEGLSNIRNSLTEMTVEEFNLIDFLARFENDSRYRRSVDKAYEIIVYALFNAVVFALEADITLSISENKKNVLQDFEDFANLVLGITCMQPKITQPARLFRVGTANANDAGLDMWANFGPAVQVKHLSLSPEQVGDICQNVQADQVIVVCKSCEVNSILAILSQLGLQDKLRGVITELELKKWYHLCCSVHYKETIGRFVIDSIIKEMWLEFPLSDLDKLDEFLYSRRYDLKKLKGLWAIDNNFEE